MGTGTQGLPVSIAVMSGGGRKREEREANAQLIAEAFNILHETGYTPRELAAAVMEYRAMVKRLLRNGMMKEEHKNAGHALLTKYQPVNL